MAIVSSGLTVDYPTLRQIVGSLQRELEQQGVGAGSLVEIRLVDYLAWPVTLALFRIRAASYIAQKTPAGLVPDFVIGAKGIDFNQMAKHIEFEAAWLQNLDEVGAKDGAEVREPAPQDLVRIILTSGTSGEAKGVGITFANLQRRLEFLQGYWADKSVELNLMGLAATGGFYSALAAFTKGRPYYSIHPLSSDFVRRLASSQIELLTASPIQLRDLLIELKKQNVSLEEVSLVRLAGASAPTALLEEVSRSMPRAEIEILYGSTEGGGVTKKVFVAGDSPAEVGRPIDGVNLEIVDESGNPCGRGQLGVVRYKTPGLIIGYLNNQVATENHFKDGWFYPGDFGYLNELGHLVLAGRDGDHVNLGGEKVNLAKFDQIADAFPGVEEAAAFLIPSEYGFEKLAIAIIGDSVDMKALDSSIRARLWSVIPSVYFKTNLIPRNQNGKTDRAKLTDLFVQSQRS
jgi:long-chain acyl-CoA synthetase